MKQYNNKKQKPSQTKTITKKEKLIAKHKRRDEALDRRLKDTFPASDSTAKY